MFHEVCLIGATSLASMCNADGQGVATLWRAL